MPAWLSPLKSSFLRKFRFQPTNIGYGTNVGDNSRHGSPASKNDEDMDGDKDDKHDRRGFF